MASGKTVDQLIIEIKADTRQLKKELKDIQGKIKTTGVAGGAAFGAMGGASGALAGSLKKLAGPLALGAIVVGIGKAATASARAGMEFEDLKDSLDTVFGSIEAGDKQFKRILDFAQTTPFQIDTVTKAFIALGSVGIEPTNRMMQVFADTASVAVDQRGAFEALIRVVQRAEAGALGLQELNMLADRGIDVFKGLKEELGLSRLELTDFGQTAGGAKIIVESLTNVLERQFGGAMVNKMDNLSVAVSNMGIAFKNLGNEISKSGVGDIFKSMANQAAQAANSIATSLAAMRGEGLGIALQAPTITTEMEFEQRQEEKARAAKANMNAILDKMKELSAMKPEAGFFGKFMAAISTQDNPMGLDLAALSKGFSEQFGQDADDIKSLLTNLNKEYHIQVKALGEAGKSRKTLNKEEKEAMLIAGKNVRVFGLLQKSIEDAKGDTELFVHAQKQLGEIFKANSDFLISEGIKTPEELGKAFEKLAAESGKLATVLDDELQTIVTQTSHAFATDFVNALLNSESALESFKSFAQSMVAQILATFMQLKIINPILNSIFGAGTFATGNGAGKSSGGGGINLAGGGTIQSGRATLVGERGPEIFVPNTGGTIMNNMNSKNAMGGGGTTIINQSINFATGVVPTVRAEIMSMLPQIAEVSKGAVAEAAMRGGSYRRALQGNG